MGQALRLANNFVILSDKFRAETIEVTEDLYQRLDQEYRDFAGHLLVSSYAFDDDWPTWEVHPAGDDQLVVTQSVVNLVPCQLLRSVRY